MSLQETQSRKVGVTTGKAMKSELGAESTRKSGSKYSKRTKKTCEQLSVNSFSISTLSLFDGSE